MPSPVKKLGDGAVVVIGIHCGGAVQAELLQLRAPGARRTMRFVTRVVKRDSQREPKASCP